MSPLANLTSLVLVCTVFSGCALIPFPYPYNVTASVRAVRVIDTDTGHDIPNATVTFSSEMGDLHWGTGPDSFSPRHHQVILRSHDSQSVEAQRLLRHENGAFDVEKRIRIAILRPWGIGPLGTCMSQEPFPVFEISAPGYGSNATDGEIEYAIDDSGLLTAYLRSYGQQRTAAEFGIHSESP